MKTISFLFLFIATPLLAAAPDAQFEETARAYLEQYLKTHPEEATALGDHRFDGEVTDYSKEARARELAMNREFREKLGKIEAKALSPANSVDLRILRDNLDYRIFQLEELKEPEWNPLAYDDALASGVYLLIAREFAPAEKRLASIKKRMEGIPAVIVQAKGNLQNPPRIHTETAIERMGGAIGLMRDGVAPLLEQVPSMKEELAPVQAKAVAALEEYKGWLEKDLLPRSKGDFRLGPARFKKKLRFALASELSMEDVMKRAQKERAATQVLMFQTALPLHKKYFPEAKEAELADQKKVVRAVLDKLAEEHPTDETIVALAEKAVRETTDFVREKDLVTVPDKPLQVIVMPEFKRGTGIAYCDSPGPLEENGETFYAVEPTPESWSPERKLSFYREYNNHMVKDLTVHEAMPGHYLQLAHANRFKAPTLVRAVFQSGPFIEGWAVYAEKTMAAAGYGGPEVKMQQLKMRLRAIINAILDQSIHAGRMTEKEALDLMMNEGFQQEGEAVAKWKRARLTSAQLSTYFVGASEMDELREKAEKKGDFNLKKYHDAVLSFGSPPPKYVAEMMGL